MYYKIQFWRSVRIKFALGKDNYETFSWEYISKFTNEIQHSLNKILVLKEIILFWCKFNKLMSFNKVNAKQ